MRIRGFTANLLLTMFKFYKLAEKFDINRPFAEYSENLFLEIVFSCRILITTCLNIILNNDCNALTESELNIYNYSKYIELILLLE